MDSDYMNRRLIDELKNKSILCWGIGRHFYSTTYKLLIKTGLIRNIKYLIDRSVKTLDIERVPNLAGISIVSPEKIKELINDNTIILISVASYNAVLEDIEFINLADRLRWMPDVFLEMLQRDEDILSVRKTPDAPKPYHKNDEIIIPKVINSFWFSNDPIPEKYKKCVESWKRNCPDYEIRIWSLLDYNSNGNRYFEEAISVKKWAFASDFSRIDVVCRYGGVYMDLDVEIVRPIDDLLYNNAYLGFEDFERIDCGSGFGSVAGNSIFEEIRDEYKNRAFILSDGSYDQTTCPEIYTGILEKHGLEKNGSYQEFEGITVYPFEYLSAKSFLTGIIYRTENTYSIHHHEGSWLSKESKENNNSRYNTVEEFAKIISKKR